MGQKVNYYNENCWNSHFKTFLTCTSCKRHLQGLLWLTGHPQFILNVQGKFMRTTFYGSIHGFSYVKKEEEQVQDGNDNVTTWPGHITGVEPKQIVHPHNVDETWLLRNCCCDWKRNIILFLKHQSLHRWCVFSVCPLFACPTKWTVRFYEAQVSA